MLVTVTAFHSKDTVTKEHQDDEVGAVVHTSTISPSLWLDAIVHHLIPIFSSQDLDKQTYGENLREVSHAKPYLSQQHKEYKRNSVKLMFFSNVEYMYI